ncbi:hypothetical protein PV721_30175 [Streptomyces sp. MB09-01]|uniref:hypothetical protein n=1 Tax=Streptomyces sp. MB09-01 TaxID=3028666 RepID=UPI0029AE6F8B|nr:hypothetical protein [Streptomyces sp. MB09-01]MDX3538541.1 hypothetical protein [Streptomyces sp. MB09-01]
MSVSIGIILVVVTAVIAAIALAPAVTPAESDEGTARPRDEDTRRTGRSRRHPRRLRHIPPQQTGDRRRSFG